MVIETKMRQTSCLRAFIVVLLLLFSESQNCHQRITISSDQNSTYSTYYFDDVKISKNNYCILEVKSDPDVLIDLNLYYTPRHKCRHEQIDADCTKDYLHVGNDGSRIDHELMTSYKFCDEIHEENIVSRYNYLWIVLKSFGVPRKLKFDLRAKVRVACKATEFRCSPIQCVSTDVICDGVSDCHNGRDEFCHQTFKSNSCFHCFDGTCINPVLPRYHVDWGRKMWYLCDGFKHCADGTDERKDICYRVDSRVAAMMNCIPDGGNTSVMMWNTVRCNGKKDCLDGSDEHREMCSGENGKKEYRPIAVAIVVSSILLLILISVCLLRIHKQQQQPDVRNSFTNISRKYIQDSMVSQRPTQTMYSIAEEVDTAQFSSSSSTSNVIPYKHNYQNTYDDDYDNYVDDNEETIHYFDEDGTKHTVI